MTMLTEWTDTWFKTEEQILGMLFDGGMLTRIQIQELMKISPKSLTYFLGKIRSRGGPPLIRKLLLPVNYAHSPHTVTYALSKEGTRYVHEMLGLENTRVQVTPEGQMLHYIGLNDIAVRVVKEFCRENVKWLSTREAAEDLALWRRGRLGRFVNQDIRPDATLIIRRPIQKFLIEFDNGTESTAKLESKFRAYRNLYTETQVSELDNLPPILWITRNEDRCDYMTRVWEAMLSIDSKSPYPKMIFLVAGNEIRWLVSSENERISISPQIKF
jgi:hypothetical protein